MSVSKAKQQESFGPKPSILIVDDDKSICKMIASLLDMEGYPHRIVTRGEEALEAIRDEAYRIVVSDIYMGDVSGLDVLETVRQTCPESEVVIMTAHGSVETAVQAVRNGAFDYISKPFAVEEILGTIHRIEEKERLLETSIVGSELAESLPNTDIVGTSPQMVDIYKKVARVASIDAPVLIFGESGAGKELIARALHLHSKRAAAPFVVINCGALTETLLESELFGHERGSFTGAVGTRKGLFESAAGGTVLLDEISETSLGFQVKLLRVIQEHEIRRVGSNDTIGVDIRAVAATNRDLREMVRGGQFREDLFHRLNVFTIAVPPMRDRPEDIPMLTSYYLKQYNDQYGKSVRLMPEALEALRGYDWPGNVRELKNVVERALTFCENGVIRQSDLELGEDLAEPESPSGGSLEEMERDHIVRTLRETGGNKKKAAEILGIERRTLYNKAKRLGIDLRGV